MSAFLLSVIFAVMLNVVMQSVIMLIVVRLNFGAMVTNGCVVLDTALYLGSIS
jgi:hypothetical protein